MDRASTIDDLRVLGQRTLPYLLWAKIGCNAFNRITSLGLKRTLS